MVSDRNWLSLRDGESNEMISHVRAAIQAEVSTLSEEVPEPDAGFPLPLGAAGSSWQLQEDSDCNPLLTPLSICYHVTYSICIRFSRKKSRRGCLVNALLHNI